MDALRKIFIRDCVLYWRNGALFRGVSFCLICGALFVVSLGLQEGVLRAGAMSILWIVAILSCLMSFDLIFRDDFEDGTLDQYAITCTFEEIAIAKIASYWLMIAIPIVLVIPVLAIPMKLSGEVIFTSLAGFGLGTLACCGIGSIGAALTISLKRGGFVLPFVVVPLCIPVLLLGIQLDTQPFFSLTLIGGIALFTLVLAPIAVGMILRVQYQ